LAANKVELKEVRKGGEAGTKEKAFELAKEHGWKSWDEIDAATQAKYMQRASREAGENPTKYHSYQLPGAENYREVLLTLPNKKSARIDELDNQIKELYDRKPRGSANFATAEDNRLFGQLSAERNQLIKNEGSYKSSHWDEPNILAHVRMNDRNIDSKKSLHLEEIQSDWHQQGRDKGYALSSTEKQRWEAVKNKADKDLTPQDYKDIDDLGKRAVISGLPPDAPFKKTWHELALKRMIREAAEKGYDRLSWTPGEAQAARYDLSKQLDRLKATPILDQNGLKYEIKGYNKNQGGEHTTMHVATESELPNIVGKEMAQKIIKETEGKKPVDYKGIDLKIGGEGMKGFYDQIIPKALEKLGKEHGVKVKKGGIGTDNKSGKIVPFKEGEGYYIQYVNGASKVYKTKAEAEAKLAKENAGPEVFYIDIPPSLKDTAMKKGFPLFSSTPGYMFVPFDGDPFASGNNK
jgi:hypothetical protein